MFCSRFAQHQHLATKFSNVGVIEQGTKNKQEQPKPRRRRMDGATRLSLVEGARTIALLTRHE
jgi:hypothetical protein